MGYLSSENILLVGSLLLFVSLLVGKTGYKFGVPALLLFLFVGMTFGTDGIGFEFNSPDTAQFIGIISLSIILFSGGMDTKIAEIRPIVGEGIVLSTVGVLLTALLTSLFIYAITDQLLYAESLLLAAVMSSTDSASVFSILRSRSLHLRNNLRPMLELESGSNDPMAYILTILLIMTIQSSDLGWGYIVLQFFLQLGIGALAGLLLGKLAVWTLQHINIQYQSLYPVLLLAIVFFIFSFTDLVNGNGYLAVYIAGVVVGNNPFIHKKSSLSFFDGFAWLCQIIMFLTLGLLVNPHEMLNVTIFSLFIGLFLIFFARPISVFISLLPFHMPWKAKVFVSWVGLRGAVPIIFATYPQVAGLEHADMIFNTVFFITILSLILQGMSIPAIARWLKLTENGPQQDNSFGVELPDEIKSAMSEIIITNEILANGNRLINLSLPDNTLVVMLRRGNRYIVPNGKTILCAEDRLLVISDNENALIETYKSLGIEHFSIKKN